MTVEDILKAYLVKHKRDGLLCPNHCYCVVDDLAPCGEINPECREGMWGKCPADDPNGPCESCQDDGRHMESPEV